MGAPMDLDPAGLMKAHQAWVRAPFNCGLEAAIRAYLAAAPATPRALAPEPPAGFVRVRVNAHAYPNGGWSVRDNSSARPEQREYEDAVAQKHGARCPTIIADIPLPAPPAEIVGAVERGA